METITKYENTYIIWRTDSGIKTIQDLKGKKDWCYSAKRFRNSTWEESLELNGMNIQQVTLVDTKASGLGEGDCR